MLHVFYSLHSCWLLMMVRRQKHSSYALVCRKILTVTLSLLAADIIGGIVYDGLGGIR